MVRKVRQIDRRTGRDATMIYEQATVVPNVLYYRRRIAKGDLRMVDDAPAAPAEQKPIVVTRRRKAEPAPTALPGVAVAERTDDE
jgi:hypothetical protein